MQSSHFELFVVLNDHFFHSSLFPFIYFILPIPLFSCSYKHILRSLQKQELSWRLWSHSGSSAAWWTKSPKTSCSFRGQAWHQPSYIWLTSDLNLLSSVKTTRTGDLLYQTIFWLSLNPLFIKENKTKVLMSTDEDNKDEPQRSHNGLHTHKPFSVFAASVFSYGG